ncbi:MAG: nucleotidyltransferase family protein [Acidimicrobiales bacterium]
MTAAASIPGPGPDGGPGSDRDHGRPTLVVLAGGRARRYGGVKPLAPVGPAGEAVVDLLASDALAAGFGTIVLVIGTDSGPAIRYHVERTWPGALDVRIAVQGSPLGTVDALLAAADHLPAGGFAVANADDLYGEAPMALLATYLAGGDPASALVGFRLRSSVVGTGPVTRGICRVDGEGYLRSVDERREVTDAGGGRYVAGDGRQPAELDGDALVSMNLWAFRPPMRAVLQSAMEEARPQAGADAEVLLPEVVNEVVSGRRGSPGDRPRFRVLATEGRCVGVTHPADLPLVQADLSGQVGRGERPATLWPRS